MKTLTLNNILNESHDLKTIERYYLEQCTKEELIVTCIQLSKMLLAEHKHTHQLEIEMKKIKEVK